MATGKNTRKAFSGRSDIFSRGVTDRGLLGGEEMRAASQKSAEKYMAIKDISAANAAAATGDGILSRLRTATKLSDPPT